MGEGGITSNKVRWALSSSLSYENQDQGFNVVEFYRNILTIFNERLDYDGDYELDQRAEEWIAMTLRWWQMYAYHIHNFITNVLSGMFPDYRKVLVPISTAKTVKMKRATFPNSRHPGR